jgi:ankyrin repeat protein
MCDAVQVNVQKAGANVEVVRAKLDRKEDLEVLEWLTKHNHGAQQSDYFNRRQRGTGQWLLDSVKFKRWVEGDKLTLFCPGIPGSGKTILTSIVINEVTELVKNDDNVGIAYLYCNFRRKSEQTARDLLASVLKQLAHQRPSLPAALRSLYDKHKDQRTWPSFEDIAKVFQSVVSEYTKVFVIIDALDELSLSDDCCSTLLSEIRDVGVNLFATSRSVPEITSQFEGCLKEDIRATEEDVKRYIQGQIEGNMPQLRRHIEEFPQLMEEIKDGIIAAVDGMYVSGHHPTSGVPPCAHPLYRRFLLAAIYLGSLNDKTTPKKVRAALADYQKQRSGSGEDQKVHQLAKAYDQAMERISGQEPGFWKLAKEALAWITCATRPLTAIELRHAIAVEKNTSMLDESNVPRTDLIISVCGGLVTIDEESDVIRLVHYTVQQYFERTRGTWFPGSQADITDACLTYLSFDAFESGICANGTQFEARVQSNPLYHYVACNWGYHARESLPLRRTVRDFLVRQTRAHAAASEAFLLERIGLGEWGTGIGLGLGEWGHTRDIPSYTTGLHLAVLFGLHEAVDFFHGAESLNMRDSEGRTPLRLAAEVGHVAVVQRLLATNQVDVNLEDAANSTPLGAAAQYGHEDIAFLLLETGQARVNCSDSSGNTPLILAAQGGSDALVKRLLETGQADVDSADYLGQTALSWAARVGNEGAVRLLLETGQVDINSTDNDGWTPLMWAAAEGHYAAVKLLLATGEAEVDGRDITGNTPLLLAFEGGHESVVNLLLGTGQADISYEDGKRAQILR